MDAPVTRSIQLESPAGDAVHCQSMGGIEGISQLFVYELDVVSPSADLKPSDWLGQQVTVHLACADTQEDARQWNGVVAAFQYVGTGDDGFSVYRVTLRPWLWHLTKTADCRIFQNMSVPEIITAVFRGRGFTDFEPVLQESYPQREYVVQYRETDFNFVSRLMERDGIYYFFRHADGKHTLVICDSAQTHEPAVGAEQLPYRAPDGHRDETIEYVTRWRLQADVQTNRIALTDFDFTRPRLELYTVRDAGESPLLEVYDYPGGFGSLSEGDGHAQLRLAQQRIQTQEFFGETNARGFSVGATFELADHPRDDQNANYLVVSARYRLVGGDVQSTGPTDAPPFTCSFRAIPAATTFRAPQRAHKALVRGPQTARVVGPSGQEIWTDQYGRVKVQFHWDRLGQNDENSSCFVRVAQAWAGDGWGAQFIPRIGQEVVVEFLEGDPDRPLITGSVYNGWNAPAFPVPQHQTQSGIRTRSTPGGSQVNGNELRFEDAIGNEDLYVQAERTQTTLVKASQTVTIGTERTLTVGGSEKIAVKQARTTNIGGGDVLTVGGPSTVEIGGDETRSVTGSSNVEIEGSAATVVTGGSTLQVIGGHTVEVAGDLREIALGNEIHGAAGSRTTTVGGDETASIGGKHSVTVGGGGQTNAESNTFVWGTYRVGAQDTITIESAKTVILRCGTTELRLTPQSLEILGQAIHAAASKEVQLSGAGPSLRLADDFQVTSSQLSLQSSGARLALADTAKLTGSQVQLGSGSGGNASPASSPQPQTKPIDLAFLADDHTPLANCHYLLEVAGVTTEGTTDGAGHVKATVPDAVTHASCTVWSGDFPEGSRVTYQIDLSALDPSSSIRGAQQRLTNLGYYSGPISGAMNDAFRDALLVFQHAQDLDTTGLLDGPTSGQLSQVHP